MPAHQRTAISSSYGLGNGSQRCVTSSAQATATVDTSDRRTAATSVVGSSAAGWECGQDNSSAGLRSILPVRSVTLHDQRAVEDQYLVDETAALIAVVDDYCVDADVRGQNLEVQVGQAT